MCNKNIKNEKFTIVSHNQTDIEYRIKTIISVNQGRSIDRINNKINLMMI